MPVADGDVIEFDYELWVEGRETLYDTTLRDAAQKAGLEDEHAFYIPLTYLMGSGRLIPGLDRALREAATGQTREVTIPAADAYGEREAKNVETVPIAEFKKNDVQPQPGLPIVYKNRRGVVSTVGGGRVRIDFNPPLAGKTLRYRFTVRSVAKSDAERIAGILRMHFPTPDPWAVRLEKAEGRALATVNVPEAVVLSRDWVMAKYRALLDLRAHTPVDEVRFVEPFRLRREEAADAPAPSPQLAGKAGV